MMFDKFKKISSNVLEYMLENETAIKPADTITDRIYKLMKKFDFYKDKKNLEKLDKTMEQVMEHLSLSPSLKVSKNEIDYFVNDPMIVDNMKESLIFLAAKENKQLAYDFITKYKPVVQQTTILKTIDNDNLAALEVLLSNPETKFKKSREDVIDPKMIMSFACQQKKMDFLQFGCNLDDKSELFFADALRYTVKNNWVEGVNYITDNFKDRIAKEEFAHLAQESIKMQNFNMAQHLKNISPESNIVIPTIPINQKIKEIREKNAGQVNTKNVLKP